MVEVEAQPLGALLVKLGFTSPSKVTQALDLQAKQKTYSKDKAFKIGEILLYQQIISQSQLDTALLTQSSNLARGKRFGRLGDFFRKFSLTHPRRI